MLTCAVQTLAQVISCAWSTEQEPVTIKHARLDFQNGMCFLEGCADVLGFTALERIVVITLCLKECGERITLGLVHHGLGLFLAVHVQQGLCACRCKTLYRFRHGVFGFLELEVSQSVCNSLRTRFGFLPAGAVIADIIRSRRVSQFLTKVPGK